MAPGYSISNYPYEPSYYDMQFNYANNPLYWGCIPAQQSYQEQFYTPAVKDTSLVTNRPEPENTTKKSKKSGWALVSIGGAVAAITAVAAKKGGGIKFENLQKGFSEIGNWLKTKCKPLLDNLLKFFKKS